MQHAVVGLPVPPTQGFPEAGGLRPLVTLHDGHLTAAVKPRLQRTAAVGNQDKTPPLSHTDNTSKTIKINKNHASDALV